MVEVFGTFILRLENQNYIGEFFNNHINDFIPEIITSNQLNAGFAGTFNASWQENNLQFTSDLTIIQNGNNVVNLLWTNLMANGQPSNSVLVGRGVVRGNILTCVYTEVKA